jgi:hypothetical protein
MARDPGTKCEFALLSPGICLWSAHINVRFEGDSGSSAPELFRHVALELGRRSVSHPLMRNVMATAEQYPAAREARRSRVAEVQERIAEVFAQLQG